MRKRLRKGFRNLTFNEKKLESTSNTAGASQNSHFTSLLWESPGLLLGLCSLLSLPHFTALSLQHCHRRNSPFLFMNIRERNYQHHLLGKQRYWLLHWFEYAKSCAFCLLFWFLAVAESENVPRQPAWFLTYSSLESVLGGLCLVSKGTFKKCSEPFKRGQADKDSNVKMLPWPWQVLSHQ